MTRDSMLVVGDIHGDVDRCTAALELAREHDGRTVFVGDYVNRGPDSQGVLDALMLARKDLGNRLVLLLGNHEIALLQFLKDGILAPFAAMGGLATLSSYLADEEDQPVRAFMELFPDSHHSLLRSMPVYHEEPGLLISHSGLDTRLPGSRSVETMCQANDPSMFTSGWSGPPELLVCGHYVQRGRVPFVSEKLICLDTGCGSVPDGPLTILRIPELDFITV